jgi:hypothetical protein
MTLAAGTRLGAYDVIATFRDLEQLMTNARRITEPCFHFQKREAVLLAFLLACVPLTGQAQEPYTTGVAVWTQHNDNSRTGAFLSEKRITATALSSRGMRLLCVLIGHLNSQ